MDVTPADPTPRKPRFRLAGPTDFPHHRSGWRYAMDALEPLLGEDGVLLDTFIESSFCWKLEDYQASGVLPYRRDWVGFVHNPPGIPAWHEYESAPQSIFALPAWRESLTACRGLFTFSRTMAEWLADRVPVPAEALIHPTESPERLFDMQQFLSVDRPRIVQVGSWLRRLHSIALLPVTRLRKLCLIAHPDGRSYLENLLAREKANSPAAAKADWSSVDVVDRLNPAGYDELLGSSVVFLDLFDAVTNNTVIECIVRGAPVLCNRLPSLVELLGHDYPLFFSTLEEAAAKVENMTVVSQAAAHLRALPKTVFTGAHFRESVARSGIYGSLCARIHLP
jgi:hypothetical protein